VQTSAVKTNPKNWIRGVKLQTVD